MFLASGQKRRRKVARTFCLGGDTYMCAAKVSDSFFVAVSDAILQFLITGLQQPQIAPAAATALQSICAQCQDQMVSNFNGLLQVAHAVDSFNLSNDAVIGVLKGTHYFSCSAHSNGQ